MSPSWKELHGHLPATIDPIQLAERGARLTGTLPLKNMPRLAQAALDGSGDVFVDISFERGEGEKIPRMHGTVRVRLRTRCQRCLGDMDLDLEAVPWLILQRPGTPRENLDDEPDILVADKPLSLSDLVEDELLLVLPMVPKHALDVCPAKHRVKAAPKPSPFAALKSRKSREP